jgi:hypothetical protein
MSIQKKSLISALQTTKKANIAKEDLGAVAGTVSPVTKAAIRKGLNRKGPVYKGLNRKGPVQKGLNRKGPVQKGLNRKA